MAKQYLMTPSLLIAVDETYAQLVKKSIAEAVITALHDIGKTVDLAYAIQEHEYQPDAITTEPVSIGPENYDRN